MHAQQTLVNSQRMHREDVHSPRLQTETVYTLHAFTSKLYAIFLHLQENCKHSPFIRSKSCAFCMQKQQTVCIIEGTLNEIVRILHLYPAKVCEFCMHACKAKL